MRKQEEIVNLYFAFDLNKIIDFKLSEKIIYFLLHIMIIFFNFCKLKIFLQKINHKVNK